MGARRKGLCMIGAVYRLYDGIANSIKAAYFMGFANTVVQDKT
jgi:hypothetical protein